MDIDPNKMETLWSNIKENPKIWGISTVLSFLVLSPIMSWRYRGIIENKESQIEILKESLTNQGIQVIEFRNKALVIEVKQDELSIKTNREIKSQALEVVTNIRGLLHNYDVTSHQYLADQSQAMRDASSSDERNKFWEKYTQLSLQLSTQVMSEYEKKYKIDSLILRDEILKRLPVEIHSDDRADYDFPTNPIGIEFVASDLERLAKLLPETQ